MNRPQLPPQMHVFVRDWLSANHVVLRSPSDAIVIDSGYAKHVPLMLALLASRTGLDGRPLTKVVNTHCHSDHIGGNAALRRAYGCTIAVPQGEAPLIAAWDEQALLYAYADQRAERFDVDDTLVPGSTYVWGDLEWRALAAPGHAMGALVFFNDEHRILISGDALWEHGFGIVMPPQVDPAALPALRATLEMIAALDARCVIPGHGEPFTGVGAALERAFSRASAFEADPMRTVRHVLKALLVFSLLDRERMALDALPGYVERVGVFRDFNAMFFRERPAQLAERFVDELERAGAVHRADGWLMPGR